MPKGIQFLEMFEGLAYNSENELIAVSSVKMDRKLRKFFENAIYIFKIKKDKLALHGYYNREYALTKCKYSIIELTVNFLFRLQSDGLSYFLCFKFWRHSPGWGRIPQFQNVHLEDPSYKQQRIQSSIVLPPCLEYSTPPGETK